MSGNVRSYRAAYYQGVMHRGAGYLRTNPYAGKPINEAYWYAGYDGLNFDEFHTAMLIKRRSREPKRPNGPLHDQG